MNTDHADTSIQPTHVVWDWPVRIIHWSLPIGIGAMWWTGEEGLMDIHSKVGYALLVLVSARLIWGFVGSYHARFSNFLAGPGRVVTYLRVPTPTVGHNPLGGWSALALLVVILVQAVSGLFTSDDILFDGPLAYWGGDASAVLAEIHDINWGVLQALIALHLVAVATYQWFRRLPLIQTMLRGKSPGKASQYPPRPIWWALVIFAIVAAILWLVITNAPEAPSYYY